MSSPFATAGGQKISHAAFRYRRRLAGFAICAAALIARSAVAGGTCGDHLLEADETCVSCAADCQSGTCSSGDTQRIAVDFSAPSGVTASAVTIRLAYRTDRVAVAGTGREQAVAQSFKPIADVQTSSANDLGYALRLVLVRGQGFRDGPLAEVSVHRCSQPPLAPTDFSCVVEGCAGGAGPVRRCTCSVRLL